MTRLILVRHGQAQSYVDAVVGGPNGCSGLSDLGRRQAAALRDRWERSGEIGDDPVLYASVLARAIQTAEIVAPAIGGPTIETHCDLCELHTGPEIDGRPWTDFEAEYEWPPTTNPYVGWAPGAESWADFSTRVGRRLDRLVADHAGRTIVVSCHGGVIEAAMVAFADLPLRRQYRLHIENTSITEWQLRDERGRERWALMRFNDSAHLAGLGE